MSTSSIKPVPTLKGIFSVPKMNHRRDFLRENKLNLRELQRVTTNKNKTSQQQEQQKWSKQQQMYQQQQQQQLNANRRSASQQRIQPQKQLTRSMSQQRPVEATQRRQPSRCSSVCSVNNGRGDADRRISNATVASKAESCDKQIQTEDINDEEFLYQALKRCTASEFNCHSSTKIHLNDIHHRQSHSDPNMPHHSSFKANGEDFHHEFFESQQQETQNNQHPQQQQQSHQQQYPQQNHQQQYQQHHKQEQYQQQHHQQQHHQQQHHPHQSQPEPDRDVHQDTQRTRNSYNLNNNNNNNDNEAYINSARITTTRSQHSHMNGHQQAKPEVEDIELNLDNLAIDANQCGQQQQPGQQLPLSGRSRLTIGSTHSQEIPLTKKKSNGSLYKFGSRDEVRLPRYLEREKREKEEQRMREMVRDPNCPLGHFALTDDERFAALATAQKKFQSLINELNHMPMTTQTLRIRTRKAEIEKELATLEADIRIFSKSKVYIKKPDETEN